MNIKVTKFRLWDNEKMSPVNLAFTGVLMRSTETLDQKGIEIYEGDVMKVKSTNEFGSTSVDFAEVFWKREAMAFMLRKVNNPRMVSPFTNSGEIIGNIHQNKEYAKQNEAPTLALPQSQG